MTPPTRSSLHAYLEPASHDRLHAFADDHGISVSALIQAFAERLPHPTKRTSQPPRVDLTELVTRSRVIDADRRKRGKPR